MRTISTISILLFFTAGIAAQQITLKGIVRDDKGIPIEFANVYIDTTTDGTSSDENGRYELTTDNKDNMTLVISIIGYKPFSKTGDKSTLNNLEVVLKQDNNQLKDVVISAGTFNLQGTSTMNQQSAVGLVTTGGSAGNLAYALSSLPGAQASGVDGKLQVRGGSSYESQTYIDGMHVMTDYDAAPLNSGSRSKYSPFIFENINLSMGGYSPEYSQSLSSVLPMETKDQSSATKLGLNIMTPGVNARGLKAWNKVSAAIDASYYNLEPFYRVAYPSQKNDWNKYYERVSVLNQTRYNINKDAVMKLFTNYDKSEFDKWETNPFNNQKRAFGFNEENLYLNSTFRIKTAGGLNYFVGAALSWNSKDIQNANIVGDRFKAIEKEIHLKTKINKRISSFYKMGTGIESMIRGYDMTYADTTHINRKVNHSINGLFIINDFNLADNLLLNVSSRLEYATLNKSWAVLPRIALNYLPKDDIILSTAIGRYQQTAQNSYLVFNDRLSQERTTQIVLSAKNSITNYRVFNIEGYYKKYDKLVTCKEYRYDSDGCGFAMGVDMLYKDGFSITKGQTLEYMVSYSYIDTRRKYLDYDERVMPDFMTKHNSSITLKYWCSPLKSYIGITNRYASGRPYHNPNKYGVMNSKTSHFESLDLSLTLLLSKQFMIFASATNIMNRTNVYGYRFSQVLGDNGYYEGVPIRAYQKQNFFIGFFFSFSKNSAYNISEF